MRGARTKSGILTHVTTNDEMTVCGNYVSKVLNNPFNPHSYNVCVTCRRFYIRHVSKPSGTPAA